MKPDALKKKIKTKFGSYSEFCRIVGYDRYEFQKQFLTAKSVTKEFASEIETLVDKHRYQAQRLTLTPEKLKLLKSKIKNVSEFVEKNPSFKEWSVWAILRGDYKKATKTAKRLLEHFEI